MNLVELDADVGQEPSLVHFHDADHKCVAFSDAVCREFNYQETRNATLAEQENEDIVMPVPSTKVNGRYPALRVAITSPDAYGFLPPINDWCKMRFAAPVKLDTPPQFLSPEEQKEAHVKYIFDGFEESLDGAQNPQQRLSRSMTFLQDVVKLPASTTKETYKSYVYQWTKALLRKDGDKKKQVSRETAEEHKERISKYVEDNFKHLKIPARSPEDFLTCQAVRIDLLVSHVRYYT